MPKWIWWVAGTLLFVLWNLDSIGEYWFGGWWETVRHKPLGAWHAADLIPFIAAYLAIRPIAATLSSFIKSDAEEKAAREPQPQVK